MLPKDIDPQSLSRLANVKRDDLDEDGKRIYDELAGGAGEDGGRNRACGNFTPEPKSGGSDPDAESVPTLPRRVEA